MGLVRSAVAHRGDHLRIAVLAGLGDAALDLLELLAGLARVALGEENLELLAAEGHLLSDLARLHILS